MNKSEILALKSDDLDEVVERTLFGVEPMRGYWTPTYSSELEYAWKVVEKFIGRGFRIVIGNAYPYKPEGEWWIDLGRYRGRGATLPEAICRAALLSVVSEDNTLSE